MSETPSTPSEPGGRAAESEERVADASEGRVAEDVEPEGEGSKSKSEGLASESGAPASGAEGPTSEPGASAS